MNIHHHIYILVVYCCGIIATAAIGEDSGSNDYSLAAMNGLKGPQIVAQYEAKHAESPDNIGYRSNLALLYALSSVLDRGLDALEAERRKNEAVRLMETAFTSALSESDPDKVDVLHRGFILAQIYLTVSDVDRCKDVFRRIADRFPGDADVERSLDHANRELQARIASGYPFDALNPWDQNPTTTQPSKRTPAESGHPQGD